MLHRDGRTRQRSSPAADAHRRVERKSSLAATGKTVTAKLAIRTKPSLAGKTLRLDVEAVDSSGKRQVETDAGIIIIVRKD